MRKILLAALIGVTLLGGVAYWQYKPYLAGQIESILRAKGLQNVHVAIARMGLSGAVFEEIRFGADENPMIFKNITLKYSLSDLKAGRLDEILLENLAITAVQQETGWVIYGLEGLQGAAAPEENNNPLSIIPLSPEEMNTIPFRYLGITDSTLDVEGAFGKAHIPMQIEWNRGAGADLSYQAAEITAALNALNLSALNPQIKASLQEDMWKGSWQVEQLTSDNPALPAFTAQGEIMADKNQASVSGNFASPDEVYSGDFTLDYKPLGTPELMLTNAAKIQMQTEALNLSMPLDVSWNPQERLGVKAKDGQIQWQSGDLGLEAAQIALDVKQQESGAFTGQWSSGRLGVTAPVEVPILQAKGKVAYTDGLLDASGNISSVDKSWNADFRLLYGHKNSVEDGVRITSATMPWNNGRIRVKNIWYPLTLTKAIPVRVQVDKVDLAALMNTMTGDRIQAQGVVSGFVNVEIEPDGGFSVLNGELAAEGPGTIMMPPEVIPASNDEVNLVKDIMEDLHFKVLNISATPDENKQVGIKLSVEGNNPKVYGGHPVKLNINLTGNLIDFVEQNVMLLTRPEKFLKGNADETEQ